jgi:hypothetical protein
VGVGSAWRTGGLDGVVPVAVGYRVRVVNQDEYDIFYRGRVTSFVIKINYGFRQNPGPYQILPPLLWAAWC